jgi:hypothetical protein
VEIEGGRCVGSLEVGAASGWRGAASGSCTQRCMRAVAGQLEAGATAGGARGCWSRAAAGGPHGTLLHGLPDPQVLRGSTQFHASKPSLHGCTMFKFGYFSVKFVGCSFTTTFNFRTTTSNVSFRVNIWPEFGQKFKFMNFLNRYSIK